MILVILGVSIALLIFGIWLESESSFNSMGDIVGALLQITFGIVTGIATLVAIILICSASSNATVTERIALYEEENRKIEQQIDILVKNYQEYESGVFADATADSVIMLVNLYPELKADQLVSSQIDIYLKNNEEIKSLKVSEINADVVRWWLYFGGK